MVTFAVDHAFVWSTANVIVDRMIHDRPDPENTDQGDMPLRVGIQAGV
jgi:hypothetical protein